MDELRRDFPAHTVAATLQCAGNRRDELIQVKDIPGEAPWAGNAISHGVWTGVRLADVLAKAGVDQTHAKFVEFIGHDKTEKKHHPPFGGSVPLSKALAPETLLAYELDGQPLPLVHGFPLRTIVPGYLGARSVKWLREINVLDHPSENIFQAEEYRLHPATASKHDHDTKAALPMGEMPVTSYICRVQRGHPGGSDPMVVEGYAYVGAGHVVHRVEISEDVGEHWTQAELLPVPTDGLQAGDEEGGRAYLPLPMNALTGAFYGLVLGVVMMLFVGIAVVENHPDPRFQRRGVMTGVVQIIGNGIFGLIVGSLCGAWVHLH